MNPLTALRIRIAAALLIPLSAPTKAADPRPDLTQFEDCADACPTMVIIPAGTFEMGTPEDEPGRQANEGPRHRVTVPRFAIGKHEVTAKQWAAFVHDTGRNYIATDKRCTWDRPGLAHSNAHPVTCFYWHDAQAYVDWMSMKTGYRYRLPSEAEWEYAARAGTTSAFHFGAVIDPAHAQYAWNHSLSGSATRAAPGGMSRVGSFPPNAFGLHDMHGNAWEWVQDCWNEHYAGAPADGSAWNTGDCLRRVVRGGSWDQRPRGLRSGRRDYAPVTLQWHVGDAGFRVARDLSPSAGSPAGSTANSRDAAADIRAALADWRDASNTGDWRRAAGHYAPDALIEFPGRPDYTFAQMMSNANRPATVSWRHDFDIIELTVDRQIAVMRVKFRSHRRQPDDSWRIGETIMTTQTWRLQPDGKWRISRALSGRLPDEENKP